MSARAASSGRIGVVVRYFPKLSETFIAQEIALLEERGHRIAIYAMPRRSDEPVQPVARGVAAPVYHFPRARRERAALARGNARAFARHPLRWLRTGARALRDARRFPDRRRLRRFFEAGWLAGHALGAPGGPPDRIHSHFLYEPSEIGRYAAAILGVPHTISAHAKDIYLADPALVRELVNGASALLTCTGFGARHIAGLPGVDASRVHVVYHGVDTRRFAPDDAPRDAVPRLVSVGRLVPKKGYADVLEALARLRAEDVAFAWHVYGDGPLREELEKRTGELGLSDRVTWHGAVTQDAVERALAACDLFVCGSRPTEDGDRDGIPNSLAEAMACGVPAVATDVSGIPELVEDGRSGRIVPPADPAALADAIRDLLGDRAKAARLGDGARARVLEVFDSRRCIEACERVLLAADAGRPAAPSPAGA